MTKPNSDNTSRQSAIFPLLLLLGLLFAAPYSQTAQAAAPQVDAGADRAVALPADTVCLAGTADSGDAANPLTYSWIQKSGPAGVIFTAADSLATSAIFPGPGSYTLTLSATDGITTVSDDVTISIVRIIRVPEEASTIQGAINLANTGDIVLVAPGIYVENPVLLKQITLASHYLTTHDESFIGQTIIDGSGATAVVSIPATASTGITIEGLTIRNGKNGVDVYKAFNLFHCRIVDTADGVDLENGGVGTVIRSNTLENNSDDAVDFDKTNAGVVEDNIIRNNHDDGIEMRLQDYSGPPTLEIIIRRNKIYNNGEDGIQLIDHAGASNRAFYIEHNLIQGNIDAGLGLMSNGNTSENFEGASITDPIFLTNNTFADNNHGISGGDNMLARNNIVINSVVGLKNIDAGSSVTHTLLWNNSTDSLSSNVDATTLIADPLLDLNFYPTAGSPAIDGGVDAGFPFHGNAPDIGWVETPVNERPSANAGTDIATTLPNNTVNLTGLASDDGLPNPPGALTFSWLQLSGACGVAFGNASGANTSATFPGPGTYDIQFTANDGERSDSDKVRVSVNDSGSANHPPSVNAGPDQAIALAAQAHLNGTASDDGLPSGTLTVAWTKTDGPGTVTFADPSSLQTTATFSTAGSYQLRLTASDGELSASDVVGIVVTSTEPINTAPAVNAGSDQSISFSADCGIPATPSPCAVLDGTVTDDGLPAGAAMTTSWTKVSGPGDVIFGNTAAVDTTVSFSSAGTYVLRLAASDTLLSANDAVQITVLSPQATTFPTLYLSMLDAGTAGGVAFEDEDIIVYDAGTGTWTLFFDGSDVGLDASGAYDVDAFFKEPDGALLLSFTGDNLSVGALTDVDDEDIVRFMPTSLGSTTAGSFEMYFDGSDVGLTQSAEDIDALGFTSDGRLLISTTGSFSVAGASGGDEDLVAFTPTSLGATTSGTWALYFDGSDVGLNDSSSEDINAVDIDSAGNVYLTTLGAFAVEGISGAGEDIFRCTPATLGSTTSCSGFAMIWDGSLANRLPAGAVVDGMQLSDEGASGNTMPTVVIGSPANNAHFTEGESVDFVASASDPQDGNLTAALQWSMDGTATGDTGGSFSTSAFTVGPHTVTASVTDNDGNPDSASITVMIDPAGGTSALEVRVLASTDDAEEIVSTGVMDLASSDLELTLDTDGNQTVGLRFNAVTIPQGATITNAYVQFTVDETNSTAITMQIAGQAADNAPTFTSASGNISSRPTTGASVSWTPAAWPSVGAAGPDQRTPNIAAVIQEIVDRAGWASGNALAVIVTGNGTGKRVAEAFNGSPVAAPLLHVNYSATPPTAPSVAISSPANNFHFAEGATVNFSASATDPQEGNLTASLIWAVDGTATGDTGGSFSTSALTVGPHTVTASVTDIDGNPGSDSISVVIDPVSSVPTVTMTSPADGEHFTQGETVNFIASATDPQDGNLTAALQWSVDGTATGDTGGSFSTSALTVGPHTVTASVTDNDGNPGSDSITVMIDPAGGTSALEVRVLASTDDAEEIVSTEVMDLASSDLELTLDRDGDQTVGLRFNAVTIPQGATITNAYVQFTVDETNSTAITMQIAGQAADNAPTFTSASGNISSRPTTGASVSWTPAAWPSVGAAGTDQRTPNIAAVIQEIVNRTGWASGNSLAVIVTGNGAGKRVAEAFNGVPAAAPLLHVEYTN